MLGEEMFFIKQIIFLLWLSYLPLVFAGSDPESSSSVNGYFLGYKDNAYLSQGNSKEYLQEIKNVCLKNGEFWALGIDSPFKCKGFKFEDSFGEVFTYYSVELTNLKAINEPAHALLFSIKPFEKETWLTRTAVQNEHEEIKNIITSKGSVFKSALKNINARKYKVLEVENNKLVIFIVPSSIRRKGLDGMETIDSFVLIYKNKNGEYDVLQREGVIVGLADLNGDGVPEIQNSIPCDGTCEEVFSINSAGVYINISTH